MSENNAVRGMVLVELFADNRALKPEEAPRKRHLWFPLGAMFRLKKDHGIRLNAIHKVVIDEDDDLHYENIALLLAAGLSHEDDAITAEWILTNIGVDEFLRLLPKVMEAIGEANGGNASGAPVPPEVTGKKK